MIYFIYFRFSLTIPFGAAHTYIPYIGEYPPPRAVNIHVATCGCSSQKKVEQEKKKTNGLKIPESWNQMQVH